jgi:hypothetical protein
MSKQLNYANHLIISLLILILFACEPQPEPEISSSAHLNIDVGASITVEEGRTTAVNTDDFVVEVYQSDGTLEASFASALEAPNPVPLAPGEYYVVAYSPNQLPVAFENPEFWGQSPTVTLTAGQNRQVLVPCSLANALLVIQYSDRVLQTFSDYQTIVSRGNESITYSSTETRTGYFMPGTLAITAELTYDLPSGGSDMKTISGNLEAEAGHQYTVTVDATDPLSSTSISIEVDESVIQEEVLITDDNGGPPMDGSIIISEIMYNPTALSDTDGEWIELYNTTNQMIDINNLVIWKDQSPVHTINASVEIQPGGFAVLSRSNTANDQVDYVYGSGLSLNNTGAEIAIYTYGSDGTDGSVISVVDYSTGFPSADGASISLDPDFLTANDAQIGSNWCASTISFNTGDFGSPGSMNEDCL